MAVFQPEVISLDDINPGELHIYDPNSDISLVETFVVRFKDEASNTVRDFKCKRVAFNRVALDLPSDIVIILDNANISQLDDKDDDEPVDEEVLTISKAMHASDLKAVELGLVEPKLTAEQINALPLSVLRHLSNEITKPSVNPEGNDAEPAAQDLAE